MSYACVAYLPVETMQCLPRKCHPAMLSRQLHTNSPAPLVKGYFHPGCCRRVSFPVLHSAAALARLASMAYSGVNSFFIRVLLDKKYALPYR